MSRLAYNRHCLFIFENRPMPDLLQVNIKNLGKLGDAEIRVGGLTVLAGKNGTGKSFVSKTLYSVLSAAAVNPLETALRPYLKNLHDALRHASMSGGENLRSGAEESVKHLSHRIRSISAKDHMSGSIAIEDALHLIRESLREIEGAFTKLLEESPSLGPAIKEKITDNLQSLRSLAGKSPEAIAEDGIAIQIGDNLRGNFQTNRLSKLCSDGADAADFEIAKVVRFKIDSDEKFHVPIKNGLQTLNAFSRVVYLDSPALWKLDHAIRDYRVSVRGSGNVPKYFYDLSAMLERVLSGDQICPDVFERLTSDMVIGGRLVKSSTGLVFQENSGGVRELPMTGTGVANLGIIALLIERRILDEDAFILIDGPEAYLHPDWQVEMAKSLVSLAQAGVNVVLATHSPDIVKYLELHVKKYPESERLISINHFLDGGVKHYESNAKVGITDVLEDLGNSYYEMYIEEIMT